MGLRDRALMLVAFSGAIRRSELAALTVDDVRFEARCAAVTLRRSKRSGGCRPRGRATAARAISVLFGRGPRNVARTGRHYGRLRLRTFLMKAI